jgi:hypothetical protein
LLDSDQASAEQLPEVQYEDMGPGEKAYAYLVAQHEAEEKRDWVAVAMNVFVAALCVGLVVLLIVGVLRVPFVNHGEPTKKIPAEGTVISADDGSTVSNPEERKPDQPVSLASGSTLRVCNLTYQAIKNCQFKKLVHPLVVERGDLLWIGQSLRAQGAIPMPYLTLKATRRSIEEQFAALKMSVDWPGHHGWFRQSFFEMAYGENGPVSLAYVPGSTELRGPSVTEHIANLPDGIMEGGISLASLGPPVTCGGCAARYRRYVFFKVKVETPKKQTHINNY